MDYDDILLEEWLIHSAKHRRELRKRYACGERFLTPNDILARSSKKVLLNSGVTSCIWKGDITQLEFDAIVNPANCSLLGGRGVDGAIHRAAGPSLKEECSLLHGCEVGEAKVTKGYALPSSYVIHTVGPRGVDQPELLAASYINILKLASQLQLETLAFPCISCGAYGFPVEGASPIALRTTCDWLAGNATTLKQIVFVVYTEKELTTYTTNLL